MVLSNTTDWWVVKLLYLCTVPGLTNIHLVPGSLACSTFWAIRSVANDGMFNHPRSVCVMGHLVAFLMYRKPAKASKIWPVPWCDNICPIKSQVGWESQNIRFLRFWRTWYPSSIASYTNSRPCISWVPEVGHHWAQRGNRGKSLRFRLRLYMCFLKQITCFGCKNINKSHLCKNNGPKIWVLSWQ